MARLLERDGPSLRVVDLDILDGAPLLDIKPYVACCCYQRAVKLLPHPKSPRSGRQGGGRSPP